MKTIYLTVCPWATSIRPFEELYEAVDYLMVDYKMSKEEAIENITRVTTGNFTCYTDESDGKVREY